MDAWFDTMCKSGQCTRTTKKTSSTSKGKKVDEVCIEW